MSQELRDKILEDNLVNRKLMINGQVDDTLIDLCVMQIFKFNEEDDMNELEESKLAKEFRTFDRKNDPIKVFLHSPGGKVVSSLSLISAMETSKTPVYTYCLGQAASAAAVILLAGHKRFCQKYSTAMIHEMSGGVHGTVQEQKEFVGESIQLQAMYDSIITKHTKIKQQQLTEMYAHKRDWTFTSAEMLKLKLVDEIF